MQLVSARAGTARIARIFVIFFITVLILEFERYTTGDGTHRRVYSSVGGGVAGGSVAASEEEQPEVANAIVGSGKGGSITVAQPTGAPAPAVTQETANAMEEVTQAYIDRLNELNETLEKVSALSERLSIDSEEMENLNRTLTGIARVYEMQLKSASQQITTQDSINEQTSIMANKIKELNGIYSRMIEAMTVNMPKI